jgi:hypothetical protein
MAIRRRPSIARSTIHRGSSSMRSLGSLSPFGAGQRLGGRSRCASRSRWRLPSPWRSLRVGSSRRDTTLAPTTPGHVRDCAPTATRQRSSSYRKRASYLRVVRGQDLNLRPLGDEPQPSSHPCHSVASFRASHRAVSTWQLIRRHTFRDVSPRLGHGPGHGRGLAAARHYRAGRILTVHTSELHAQAATLSMRPCPGRVRSLTGTGFRPSMTSL